MPRISLTDNIKVWGDYFANVNHESAVKSTFRMYIDYEEVVKSAFAAAKYYVRGKDVVTTKWDHDDDPLTEEVDFFQNLPVLTLTESLSKKRRKTRETSYLKNGTTNSLCSTQIISSKE